LLANDKMNIVDFSYIQKKYTFWSGITGGFFLYLFWNRSITGRVAIYLENSKRKPMGLIMNEFLKFYAVFHLID
jgi:hypothetical protein